MKIVLFSINIVALFLIGCKTPKSSKHIPFSELSTEDSLAVVNQLFDSLYAEIYQDKRYSVFEDHTANLCNGHSFL